MSRPAREIMVVMFLVLGLGFGVAAYLWLSGRIVSARRYKVVVVFDDVSGLRAGDPVEVRGVPKGRVLGLTLEKNKVKCVVAIESDVRLTEDTKFAIRSVSYLGSDRYLMVTTGSGPEVGPEYVFEGANEVLSLENTFLRLDKMLESIDPVSLKRDMEEKARSLLDSFTYEMRNFAGRVDRLGVGLEEADRTLQAMSCRLDSLIGLLEAPSTLGKLLRSEELYQELRTTNEKLQSLLIDIKLNPRRYFRISIF